MAQPFSGGTAASTLTTAPPHGTDLELIGKGSSGEPRIVPNEFEESLSEKATFAGAGRRRPTAEMSLGNERTPGDQLGDQDTVIDDIEVVDLAARYKVEGTLGQGGMGAVLLATDTRLDRTVVIKRIPSEVIVVATPTSLQGEQPFASAGS